MSSDIKLEENNVIVEAELFKCIAWDFWLFHPSRLRPGSNPSGPRRAMVHTFDDGVGINVNLDYPGGVQIGGDLSIDKIVPKSTLVKCIATDLWLFHPSRLRSGSNPNGPRRAMVHTFDDGVGINVNLDYPGGVQIGGDVNISRQLMVNSSGVTINSDLSIDKIVPKSTLVKCVATDLWLFHPSRLRSGSNPNGPRRAMVHTFDDGVGINFNLDYPGGVQIGGDLSIDKIVPKSSLVKCIATDLWLFHPSRLSPNSNPNGPRRAMVHTFDDGVGINVNLDYPGGVQIGGDVNISRQFMVDSSGVTINSDMTLKGRLKVLSGATLIHRCNSMIEQQSMRGDTTSDSANICIRCGYSTAGDGGDGVFAWTQDTTTQQNVDPKGALIVVPNGIRTGCWKRLYTGPLNAKWFGAKGDGFTDDTESIQAAFDSAEFTGEAIHLPKGKYRTTKTLTAKSGSIIRGDGIASIIYLDPKKDAFPKEEMPCLLVNIETGWNHTLIENLCIRTSYFNSTAGIQVDIYPTTIRNVLIDGFIDESSLGFKIAGILISGGQMVRIEECSIGNCYGDGIRLGGDNPSYSIYIGPHNSVFENRGFGINCEEFKDINGSYRPSEVHIFENSISANNCNFPETKYQIAGCIGPGSIRSNHLESVSGRGGPLGALIYLGPYGRAVAVENNAFVGPDDYALIANFGTGPGLMIKGNAFSAGSIANIWLQNVWDCTIEGNHHLGSGKVKIDGAPGLKMDIQGTSICHHARYINEKQDVHLDLMDEIVYVSSGGITVTLPDPAPFYYTVKQYIVKNVSKSPIMVTAPILIDDGPTTNLGPNEAVIFASYYGVENEQWIRRYCVLGRTH